MKRVAFSPARVALIAGSTFQEAVRQRLLRVLIVVAGIMVGGALFFRDFHFGSSELKFLEDVGFGAVTFFGAILAIAAPAQLFFADIDRRTVLTVLAKPVWRAEFILGKLGGVLLLLLVFCLAMTALLAGLIAWRESGMMSAPADAAEASRMAPYAALALCGLAQWLKLGVLAALTLLVATYARSSLFAMMVGFLALVGCQLQYLARDFYGMVESGWGRGCVWLLGLVLPDFQLFNIAEKVAAGGDLAVGAIGGLAAYALAYTTVFSGLAVFCFRHREL
jgi:ABC-type transport system involved in multi-copper enzyme maturation permease subunit